MIMDKDKSERNVNSRGSNAGKNNGSSNHMNNPEIEPRSNRYQHQPSSSSPLLMDQKPSILSSYGQNSMHIPYSSSQYHSKSLISSR